jgi:serine/threonine protein kinase/Flp pilus assembly protein TadD
MELTAGDRLGPYEILAPIGAGGMGEVWKARDTRLNRIVAIKRIKGRHSGRFQQEARAIAALNHPNICQIYDVGPDYLVMEYIDGKPLKGPLADDEAVRLALQIAGAIEEAHGKGILHRDLKPGNIMVTAKGAVKLLDFGLAKLMAGADADATNTIEGTVLGTAAYMSPEQAEGKALDERSDIFSFGAVLYEVLSGRRAFPGSSIAQVLIAVLREETTPLRSCAADVVKRCMAKQPGHRFQRAAEVKAALEKIAANPAGPQPSIAVLPFANLSADKENEYFSDGLSEEIINALTKVTGLKVTARTSAFSFRGKDVEIGEIARKLNVEHILEGSVRKFGNRMRVTAQLIKAADGFHVWSERYDRELIDVFAIQDEISAAIAGQLKVSLTETRGPRKHIPAVAAYEALLQGRHHRHKFTPASLARALECLQRALSIDPEYAEAHCEAAVCYGLMAHAGLGDPRELLPKVSDAARKAAALDDGLAHAHSLLGAVSAVEHDWDTAGNHFRRSLELDRAASEAAIPYAVWYLRPLGRLEEALAELEALRQRDPLSVSARTESAHVLLMMRRYEACAEMAEQALDLEPNHSFAMFHLLMVRLEQQRYEEAIELAERVVQLNGRWVASLAHLGVAYARAGRTADARRVLGEMHELATGREGNASPLAAVYNALGEIDAAVEWVEKAIDHWEPIITTLKVWPVWDPIRSHPRYPSLLRKLNLD